MTGGDSIFGTAVRGLFIRPFIRATSKFRTRTRRGTPFGCVVPTLKVASNDALAANKPNWVDWNAMSNPDTEAFAAKVLSVASGESAKNELCGAQGIAIFKDGVTL